jgi:hypothetical protein
MIDLLVLVMTVAFYTLAAAYVVGCQRLAPREAHDVHR